jgi:hypothetical protein
MNSALRPPLRGHRSFLVCPEAGDYATIQAAIEAIPERTDGSEFVIYIRRGVYNEHLHVTPSKGSVALIGEDRASTLVTVGPVSSFLQDSAALIVDCAHFRAENLSLENSTPLWHLESNPPAVAAKFLAGDADIMHCSFLGWQDTLWSVGGSQRLRDCYIEGHSDWVRGQGKTEFENCEVHCRVDTAALPAAHESPGGGHAGSVSFFSLLWNMAEAERQEAALPLDQDLGISLRESSGGGEGAGAMDCRKQGPALVQIGCDLPSGPESASDFTSSSSMETAGLESQRVQNVGSGFGRWDSAEREGRSFWDEGAVEQSEVSRIRGGGAGGHVFALGHDGSPAKGLQCVGRGARAQAA